MEVKYHIFYPKGIEVFRSHINNFLKINKMSLEITGKLHKKFDTEQKSEKFQSREFVLEIGEGERAQLVKFQLVQLRCDTIEPYNEGDEIKVHFDLRGREWNGKYLTNLNAWQIQPSAQQEQNNIPIKNEQGRPVIQEREKNMPIMPPSSSVILPEGDDLPF